ncbi:LexA family protein [Pseudomonas sp. Hp2]|uniref:LexA family protein n=1 Tax=Pseudomonas sp. Hp2 TaxID=701189 RepID=UPI0011285FBC|nr:translesion error-prone DNA polymerase V autoproteolytic subunit [Pseudomonas sp. Hp2]
MLATFFPHPPTLIGPVGVFTTRSLRLLRPLAACGFPSPAEDFFTDDDRLDLNERLIANPPATFLMTADCGGSMVDYGIQDGDLLIVDRSITPRPGHTVVALWEGGFVCKKLYVRGNRMVLASSAGFAPIIVPEDIELDVWGVVRSNVHFHL